ncbi:SANT/Myb domain containing protein, partial [Perkinsus sp. BL_2016]
ELSTFLQTVESNSEVSCEVSVPSATCEDSVASAPSTANEISISWEMDEINLLINAVKQFPGGSTNRWEQITSTLNRQLANTATSPRTFSVNQVIAQAATLQSSKDVVALDSDARDEAQTQAALNSSKKKRDPRVDMAEPTVAAHYFEVEVDQEKDQDNTSTTVIWTPEDQLALENALKTVPVNDPARWDRVAELIPGKSKKECLTRVKEIAAILKAKNSTTPA